MILPSFDLVALDDFTTSGATDISDQLDQASGTVPLNAESEDDLTVPYGETITPDPIGRPVLVSFDGTVAHGFIVEGRTDVEVDGGEEASMVTVYSGRGLASVLDRYRFRPPLAFGKSPWSTKRTFGPFDLAYTRWETEWDPAEELVLVGEDSYRWSGLPNGFPAFDVAWVGPPGTDDVEAPAGRWMYQDEFNLAEDATIVFFLAGDNLYTAWADGMKLGEVSGERNAASGFTEAFRSAPMRMSAGDHRVGAEVVNLNVDYSDPGYGEGSVDDGNPTGFVGVAYRVDGRGQLLERVWQTSGAGYVTAYYTEPPGMTIVEIIEATLAANLADDYDVVPVVLDEQPDQTFPELPMVTVPTGGALLTELRDVWGGRYLDFHVPPVLDAGQFQLQVWEPAGRGVASGVTFATDPDPNVGDLTSLRSALLDAGTDVLLVTWLGGPPFRFPATGGTRMALLPTTATNLREAQLAAAYVIAQPAQPEQLSCGVAPVAGSIPGVDFDNGDTVTVGPHADQRTYEWRYDFGDDHGGEPDFAIEVNHIIPTPQGRLARKVRSILPGGDTSLDTTSPAAPTFEPQPFGSTIKAHEIIFRPLDPGGDPVSPMKRPHSSFNLYAVAVTATVAGTTDTEFEFKVEGTDVLGGSGVLPTGDTFALIPVDPIVWVEGNRSELNVDITNVGDDVEGLIFEPRLI